MIEEKGDKMAALTQVIAREREKVDQCRTLRRAFALKVQSQVVRISAALVLGRTAHARALMRELELEAGQALDREAL